MSSVGNSPVISEIEENDLGFSRLWSQSENLDCGTIFLNPELHNDLFFNKLVNVTCVNEVMIKNALTIFRKYDTTPFVYSLNYPELETMLQKQNFTHYDTQHVLKRNNTSKKTNNVYRINDDDSMLWSKTFCNAYDCYDWLLQVDRIVKNTLSLIEYYVDESISSCMALYQTNSLLGLYCLGTIPSMRRRGLAELLIDFAQTEVNRRKLKFLMLETYQKDNLLDFYAKLGFQEIYQKKIYTI